MKQKAFTLVELIVVVTILAILATIGFVSYSSYLTGVRDTNRLAQLVSIHDGLELYRTRKDLPLPDDNVEIHINTQLVSYQGNAGSSLLESIDFTKGGKDPKTGEYFTYYLTKDKKSFQLMAFLEEAENILGDQMPSELSLEKQPVVYGDQIGALTDNSGIPIQNIPGFTQVPLDISNSPETYILNVDDLSKITGTGGYISDFIGLVSNNDDVLSENTHGIVMLDFNSGIEDKFKNYDLQNIGTLGTTIAEKGRGLECDGLGRLVVGSGATLFGGLQDFTSFVSYNVEKGDNTDYEIVYSSWGSAGYNVAMQHNFITIDNPSISAYTRVTDLTNPLGSGEPKYGNYNKILFSVKDGKYFMAIDRKVISEGVTTSEIIADTGGGLGICARPTGGYNLDGIIDTLYISKSGIDISGADAFYSIMNIAGK